MLTDARAGFSDHYSDFAADYARYRPRYPDALYEALVAAVPGRERCWDVATGNGQAALALARYFDEVVAIDASADQLAQAAPHPRIAYRRELAEKSSLPDASVDLVTVAAALHWLELPAFYAEVRRVVRPGGVLAAWTYSTAIEIAPAIDAIIDDYVRTVLGPHWAPELDHVSLRYRELPFPFPEIELGPLAIETEWTLPRLVGQLNTWSAAGAYRRRHGRLATDGILARLTAAWTEGGAATDARPVRMPLYARVGRIGEPAR
jgi:SAM-dependent methyltransferase